MTNELSINRLDEIAQTVNQEHAEIEIALRDSMTRVVKVGELLTEAKQLVDHGEWLPWIAENCAFSERTAQNYMRVFNKYPELSNTQHVADLTYREAVGLLAEPKEQEPAELPQELNDFLMDGVKADNLRAEIAQIREEAERQTRGDVPGTLQARNNQAIARLNMQRACGRWINRLHEKYGKERAEIILENAGLVADYAAQTIVEYIPDKKSYSLPPKKLQGALDDVDIFELDELAGDCIAILTVCNDDLCEIPEVAREAFRNDPAYWQMLNLIAVKLMHQEQPTK